MRAELTDWYNRYALKVDDEGWRLAMLGPHLNFWVGGSESVSKTITKLMTGRSLAHREARRLLQHYNPDHWKEIVAVYLQHKVE